MKDWVWKLIWILGIVVVHIVAAMKYQWMYWLGGFLLGYFVCSNVVEYIMEGM